jgi:hypothetical protein
MLTIYETTGVRLGHKCVPTPKSEFDLQKPSDNYVYYTHNTTLSNDFIAVLSTLYSSKEALLRRLVEEQEKLSKQDTYATFVVDLLETNSI